MDFECESMASEDYRIIVKNDTTIKCFRDGRVHKLCKVTNQHCKKGQWNTLPNKPNKEGYISIHIGRKSYRVHRLMMEAFAGESEQEVDHIDRNKINNNFHNLRYVTPSENNWNRDFVEFAKGYYWYESRQKWIARIYINGKSTHLGCFDKEHDARQAYLDARAKREQSVLVNNN